MPRPSDVYATFGAPGVYQATPCTPSRLPNVYVFPPEEDNQAVYCLFHSGSASPTTFESFYSHPVYTQRDPNSPTLTDLRDLDHALSYFQRHSATHNSPRYGPLRDWEHDEERQTTPRNSLRSTASSASSELSLSESLKWSSDIEPETETSVYPIPRHLGEAEEQYQEQWEYESNSPSRRSSVFGDRSPDYEALESRVREEDQPASRKSQSMNFRSRAAMALKGLGSAMSRRLEAQVPIIPEHEGSDDRPTVHESWFGSVHLRKKRSCQTLAQPLHSHVDFPSHRGDFHREVAPIHPSSAVRDPKVIKRKSITQLFGTGRTSVEIGTEANGACLDLGHPAARSSSSLPSSVGELKLSKRKSVVQLLGMGRGASSIKISDHAIVAAGADDAYSDVSEALRVGASRTLEGPYTFSEGSSSLVSLEASGPTVSTGRRKSFLNRRGLSFLDFHRHFVADHGSRPSPRAEHTRPAAPAMEPSDSFSPDSLSEATDSSSSVAASTECEQTTDDDMHFPMPDMSTIMGQGGVALAKDFEPNLLSRSQTDLNEDSEDTNFLPQFRLGASDDVESEMGEDPPALELAVRLNSLTFDQLVFDAESFMGSVYD